MKTPPFLSKGSKVALVAPARKISFAEIEPALFWLKAKGFVAVFDERLFAVDHQFAGDDAFRAVVFQNYLDRSDIDAIWFVRGGYGGLRIVDKLNFEQFSLHPKWIIGYSDSTVFHGKLQSLGYQSLHATMPINVNDNSQRALDSLYMALTCSSLRYVLEKHVLNRNGKVKAEIIGGNISVLYSMLGSDSFPDTEGKILFLEDLDEYLYHIDRMIMAFKRAGILSRLSGLLVGGLTDMHDNAVPFGKTAAEIIAEHVSCYHYPVAFGFPAGHFNDNRAIVLGREVDFEVAENGASVKM
jgi:Uncharacterized proteins, homologs of microcin C7 resistance protein MccF